MLELVLLPDRQRVHVGPERDAALGRSGLEYADDAGAGEAAMDLDAAEGLEQFGHLAAGHFLLERELGVAVEVPAPGPHLFVQWIHELGW